jgi:hypothetical protein
LGSFPLAFFFDLRMCSERKMTADRTAKKRANHTTIYSLNSRNILQSLQTGANEAKNGASWEAGAQVFCRGLECNSDNCRFRQKSGVDVLRRAEEVGAMA